MLNFVQHIAVIGLGGIGTWFLTPFARFLHEHHFAGEIILADGDTFSTLNAHRQDMEASDVGRPKAAALAERLARTMPGLHLRTFTEYVTADNVAEVVKEKSLVAVAVDNHPARAIIARHAADLMTCACFPPATRSTTATCTCILRRAGKDLPRRSWNGTRRLPRAAAATAPRWAATSSITLGEPQLLVTNFLAAAALLVAFHALWDRDAARRMRGQRPVGLSQETLLRCAFPGAVGRCGARSA